MKTSQNIIIVLVLIEKESWHITFQINLPDVDLHWVRRMNLIGFWDRVQDTFFADRRVVSETGHLYLY